MLLFEKSAIGAYCNRLYDLKKDSAPFHAKAELKQTAHAKILMSPILMRKRAHHIVENAYHQTAHFFMSQKRPPFGRRHQFRLCFTSPLLLFKKLRMVVCVIVLSF